MRSVAQQAYSDRELRYQQTIAGRAIELSQRNLDFSSPEGNKIFDLTTKQFAKNFSDLGYAKEKVEFDLKVALDGVTSLELGYDYIIGKSMLDLSGPKVQSNIRPDIQILRGDNTARIEEALHLPEAQMNTLRHLYGLELRSTVNGGETFKTEHLLKLFSNIGGVSATVSPAVESV